MDLRLTHVLEPAGGGGGEVGVVRLLAEGAFLLEERDIRTGRSDALDAVRPRNAHDGVGAVQGVLVGKHFHDGAVSLQVGYAFGSVLVLRVDLVAVKAVVRDLNRCGPSRHELHRDQVGLVGVPV